MTEAPPDDTAEKSPVPAPDLPVVEEIQAAILDGLLAVPRRKAEGKPVVWTSVVIPQAIFHAMDVPAMYQELLGVYVSIFRLSPKYCQAAEESGLPRDVCAVHRCAVGVACCEDRDYFFEQTFVPPDLVVGTNFPCISESRSCLHTGFTLDPDLIDPDRPFESLAHAQIVSPANPLLQTTIDYFVRVARQYRADGVVSVVKRTCGFIPAMQRLIKDAIQRETGLPSVIFDLDGVDQREYDAAATQEHLDTFVETLLARKGRS